MANKAFGGLFIGKQIISRTMGAGAAEGFLGEAAADAAGRQATQAMANKAFGGNAPSFVQDALAPPPPQNAQGFMSQAMGGLMGNSSSPNMGNMMGNMMGGGSSQPSSPMGNMLGNMMGGGNSQPSMQNP